ncbi:phage tail terminator family protein [Desulforamulus ruminis]|uniref:Phage protein n=1 Tax=Desulforamulus ruminis (strain ATCC 23193 / DSM 2154 / NCIMB 8452 / DL) TaxID=696281 RepID=F6DPL0_DESRL|nr:hypothetical protein [Desulforamulus ruminis]AEG59587.1 phage protein [Desulforamulus ruminis DSM 2154]
MLNKIVDAIGFKLGQAFGDEFTIYSDTEEQGVTAPCFFIAVLSPSQQPVIGRRYFKKHPFDIHYYPQGPDKQREINDVADSLKEVLAYITTDGHLLAGTKMHHQVLDGILHFYVEYNLFVLKQMEPDETMGELTIHGTVKG